MSGDIVLSAVISVHNEEHQLRDCLASLDFADEIVVLLDKCYGRFESHCGSFHRPRCRRRVDD